MNPADLLDWFARLATILGLPGVLIYLVRDRRTKNAEARSVEADALVDEETVPDKLRTSSIATIEAEIAAMQRAFDISRAADAQTIERLRREVAQERESSAAKDVRISELETRVAELKTKMSELSDELAHVSDELRSLHDDPRRSPRP